MEKKDLIKIENAAIRAAGSRMAKMFKPIIPMGPWEHEGDKEARRAFYEGFQEGAAYYRLLMSRINDEFANLIEGARLDSGCEEDTHSVMEMCMKNGIPVITAVQTAPGKKETEQLYEDIKNYIATVPFDSEVAKKFAKEHTTESEPGEPSKDDSDVPVTMESLEKIQELSDLVEPVLKEGDIGVTNTDGWVSAQKAIEMKVGDFVILAENLNIDDGLGGIAVSDEHPEYGRYYTWDAAVRVAKKIKGWHLPTAEEAIAMNNEAHKGPNPVIFLRTGYLLADSTHNKFRESDLVFWTATEWSDGFETPYGHEMAMSLCVADCCSHITAKRTLFSVKLFKDKE